MTWWRKEDGIVMQSRKAKTNFEMKQYIRRRDLRRNVKRRE